MALITSKTLKLGLVILAIAILLGIALLYFMSRLPGSHPSQTTVQGYNTSARNQSGYNQSGYNKSGYNSSVPIVKKGGPG